MRKTIKNVKVQADSAAQSDPNLEAAPSSTPFIPPTVTVDIVAAINNMTAVVRAFSGTAEQHELLAASLATIRDRCGF